jgi:hypothetical protein
MGAPGYVQFCKSGHIVKQVAHHFIDDNDVIECPWCHSNVFHFAFEFGDPSYYEDINYPIPQKPITYEWHKIENENFRGEMRIAVYDVSKVTKWRRLGGKKKQNTQNIVAENIGNTTTVVQKS